jgi:single-strand DNA-binding protein
MIVRSLNRVQLIGNLGADPDLRISNAGDSVATISVATSYKFTDKQSGETQERTDWHRCVLWRRLAEIASEYLRTGSRIYVEGRLITRKWQDEHNQTRYTTEIHVNEMIMLDRRMADDAQMNAAGMNEPNGRSSKRKTAHVDNNDDLPF